MNKVRVLFLPSIDADNTNAQSLNTREVVLRLDPERIESTLWYEREPDLRFVNRAGVRLLKLPKRRKTLRILREELSGYHVLAYTDYSPASYLFVHLPRSFRRGTKAVLHVEAPAAQIMNPPQLLKFLYRGVFGNTDFHTAISAFVARDVCGRGHTVSHILPVGVDTKFFSPPPSRSQALTTVLFVGTVMERKGPQHLLEAAARFPQAKFRIIGAPRDRFDKVLQDGITALGLKNVSIEGPQPQSEIVEIMRQSDIFVLPSRLEGIPKVSLEAAATGLPCIVFRDYESPSVVDGVTGFQVSSVEELVARTGQLVADSTLRTSMGHAARKHAQLFDWDTVAKRWQQAYLSIADLPHRS